MEVIRNPGFLERDSGIIGAPTFECWQRYLGIFIFFSFFFQGNICVSSPSLSVYETQRTAGIIVIVFEPVSL